MSKVGKIHVGNSVLTTFCVLIVVFLSSTSWANVFLKTESDPIVLERKMSFILSMAENVTESVKSGSNEYIIGIYGKSDESKELYEFAKDKAYKVNGKKVTFSWFKRLGAVKEADLIYLHNDNQEDFSEIKERTSDHCLLVTEDFPYGKSPINFIVNDKNEVVYVLNDVDLRGDGKVISSTVLESTSRVTSSQGWKKSLQIAQAKIKAQESTISHQESEIIQRENELKKSDSTIVGQQETIKAKGQELMQKQEVIAYQRTLIIVVSIAGLIILGLLFFVYNINQKRKIALEENERKTKEILASITYAQRIQQASLPSNELLEKSLKDGFIMYNPKDIVSGDFYWLEENDDAIYFAVADCTGHGVPGALLSVLCCNFLSRSLNELKLTTPSKILDSTVVLLEQFFAKSGDKVNDGMDVVLCKIDKKTKIIEYSGANRPLYYFKNGEFIEQKGDRQPIGKYEYRKPYENHSIELSKGDSVYLFSDGIVDQFGGPNGKKYSSKRLRELLQSIHQHEMDLQKELIQEELKTWKGTGESIDDACMLGVRIT